MSEKYLNFFLREPKVTPMTPPIYIEVEVPPLTKVEPNPLV